MITEDQKKETVAAITGSQEQEPISSGPVTLEKHCPSPCSTGTSPSPSPSAAKSSTESGTATSSSGDEGEGNVFPRQNGLPGSVTPDGVLTPPTDIDGQTTDSLNNGLLEKPVRYNGRLEFYKEGVLCLELSNVAEGDGRKWLKTKGRSDIRQVVKVSKEVTIPRSTTPSSLILSHPSNGISFHENMSDEESSRVSSSASPKSREKSWRKQAVPQKFVSRNLDFFMKPSFCVHRIPIFKQPKVHQRELTPRRPYMLPNISQSENNSALSCERCKCGEPKRRKRFSKTKTDQTKENISFDKILLKLHMNSERNASLQKVRKDSQSPRLTPQKILRQYPAPGASRKRSSRDVEGSDFEYSTTPRKSPTKNLDKMILSVPGIGRSAQSGTKPRSLLHGCDSTDGKVNNFESSPPQRCDRNKRKSSGLSGGSRKSPPCSLLRPTPDITSVNTLDSPFRENANASDDSAQDTEETLSPEEQEQFQQHAMSKAISYTITSLLGGVVPPTALGKKLIHAQQSLGGNSNNSKLLSTTAAAAIHHASLFGNEQDKNSFLRHLLDTSDPIPTSSSHASPTIPSKVHGSPEVTPKLKSTNKGKRLTRPHYGDDIESKIHKGRSNSKNSPNKDAKVGIINHGTMFGGPGPTGSPVQHHLQSYPPFSIPPTSQLESLAAMQFASQLHSHFISPPVAKHVYNSNHVLPHLQPLPSSPRNEPEPEDDAPINLSQKDGEWPKAKLPNDRASRLQGGRAFPIVPHRNLSEESDPDLPLNLCKKRRDD